MSELQKISDRGATPYFHGRETILNRFEDVLVAAKKSKSGTTFIVQGPPGIGKTALLAECWEKAKKRRWQVTEIDLTDLWNADKLGQTLKLSTKKITRMKTLGGGGKLGGGQGELGAQFEATSKVDLPMATPLRLIQKTRKPLLLILDEAQRLGESNNINGPYKDEVSDLLYRIHNGKVGKPVILLAGGLGMTFEAFEALGISRIAKKCKFNMGPLEKEEERTVIKDWLKKEGKAEGDTTDWVAAIANETYGWPQHIIAYTEPAADHLKKNGRKMTGAGLVTVLGQGRETRREYYEDRLSGFTAKECRSLARILVASSEESGLEQEEVVEQLDREYGVGKGKKIFFRAVRKGVFYLNKKLRCYSVPIPSMRNFIIKNFPPKEISQQPDSKPKQLPEADPEKEPKNHTTDSPSPEKEEGKEPTIPKSGKGNLSQDLPQGKDPSDSDRDTDMGVER